MNTEQSLQMLLQDAIDKEIKNKLGDKYYSVITTGAVGNDLQGTDWEDEKECIFLLELWKINEEENYEEDEVVNEIVLNVFSAPSQLVEELIKGM